jgi:hypothetical protein
VQPEQIVFIGGLYVLLTGGAYLYAKSFSTKNNPAETDTPQS